MNHDERNKNPDLNHGIDPELEERIVAWVMGEASALEAAELESLVKENPEAGLFRDRIKAAHELAMDSMAPEAQPLRFAPERRAQLLATLSESVEEEKEVQPTVYERSPLINWRKWIPAGAISVAASLVLVFGIIRLGVKQGELGFDDLGQADMNLPPPPPVENSPVTMQPMAAGVASPMAVKNKAAEKKQAYGGGVAERTDTSRAYAPRSKHVTLLSAPAPAPDSSRRLRSIDESKTDGVYTLLPFAVSMDDVAAYGSTATLAGTRMKSRDASESGNLYESFADKEQIFESGEAMPATLGDEELMPFDEVLKTSVEREEIPFTAIETNALEEPVSTFSLHVSDVSFRTAQAALERGEWPEATSIRPEEFYNAFDYGDPAPAVAEKVACRIDQAAHPSLQQRNLVRIAMQVPSTGRGAGQPLNLTILIDTSGSMEREDRRASVEAAMNILSTLLGPDDHVNVIGFARQPRLLAEGLPGDQADQLADIVAHTPSEGGTNLEDALDLSLEIAQRHYDPAAQNRIVLMTDGAANLGDKDPESFTERIDEIRQQGIAFDATGVGTDGMNDTVLEALTRKGNGRYYVIDRPEDADENFARQLAGAFRPAAENVKVQVRFNPSRVGNYRLIGFEKHRLNEEDFRDDRVDAAELAAEETAVALYQVEVLPEGEGELGEVFVRFRDTATGEMVERSWTAPYDPGAPVFDRAAPEVQLAGTAALLAEVLQGRPGMGQVLLDDLASSVNQLRGYYAHEERVQELVGMYEHLREFQNTDTE